MTAHTAYDITAGIDSEDIADLPMGIRHRFLCLMARASERAYRRGFQQGAHIATARPQDLPGDLHEWRYGKSTDLSPWAGSEISEPSSRRLLMENPELGRFGLRAKSSRRSIHRARAHWPEQ